MKNKYDVERHGVGDEFQVIRESSEVNRYLLGSKSIDEIKATINKIIEAPIPRPPDFKSQCFLDIIKKEYELIKARATKFLETSENQEQICFFAQSNIQSAKKFAGQAHEIGKTITASNGKKLNDPNSYIAHILKIFLLRSILLYQELFEPYIKSVLKNYLELIPLLGNETDSEIQLENFGDGILALNGNKSKSESLDIEFRQEVSNCFSLKGDYWKVRFCGTEINIRALKGTRYLVHLLGNPHKPFYCHELTSLVEGIRNEISMLHMNSIDPVESSNDDNFDEQRIQAIDPIDHDMSSDDMRNIINHLNDLVEKLRDPQIPESEKNYTHDVLRKVRQHLDREYGIYFVNSRNGRLIPKVRKRLIAEFERIRINVKKHISKTISDLRSKIPALSYYLKNHIHTGMKCEFRPDPDDAGWDIRWN